MSTMRTLQPGAGAHGRGSASRLHIAREGLPAGQDGRQTICGKWVTKGIVRNAPHQVPDGLRWCHKCLAELADKSGRLHEVAAVLGLGDVPPVPGEPGQ